VSLLCKHSAWHATRLPIASFAHLILCTTRSIINRRHHLSPTRVISKVADKFTTCVGVSGGVHLRMWCSMLNRVWWPAQPGGQRLWPAQLDVAKLSRLLPLVGETRLFSMQVGALWPERLFNMVFFLRCLNVKLGSRKGFTRALHQPACGSWPSLLVSRHLALRAACNPTLRCDVNVQRATFCSPYARVQFMCSFVVQAVDTDRI
jgi:hypothetical protein